MGIEKIIKNSKNVALASALVLSMSGCMSNKGPALKENAHNYETIAKHSATRVGGHYRDLAKAEKKGKLSYDPRGCDAAVLEGYRQGRSTRDALLQIGFDALLACGIKSYIDGRGNRALCVLAGASSGSAGSLVGTSGGSTAGGATGNNYGLPNCN